MIVDANVFKGYYEAVLGRRHSLCGCPQALISSATSQFPIFHDLDGIVEAEWRQVVDYEWFDAWLSDNLQRGNIQYANPIKDRALEKSLKSHGFPTGRDIVYVRLGLANVSVIGNACNFYTEDIDFYDPALKNSCSKTRLKLISSSGGPIPKVLKKRKIIAQCVP